MPRSIGVVGASRVGKTSFVLALGAREAIAVTATTPRRLAPQYLWPRPGGNGHKVTTVRIFRHQEEVGDGDEDVFVLLFDLARRETLAEVIAQWAHLSDAPGRRLLLVGTHADRTSDRQVLADEVREISGEFHAYEEVCCRRASSGDEGMLRIQLLLMQWTAGDFANNKLPERASVCGAYPSSPLVSMWPSTSHSLPSSPAAQQKPRVRADVWLYDPNEEGSSSAMESTGAGGDVKLRTISKAIFDIRGAVAEKSKALAKYRDRHMSQWLMRSRYFGPTESSRHKRWQEDQKKRQQLAQNHMHQHHSRQPSHGNPSQQRTRSVSHPEKVEPVKSKSTARRNAAQPSSASSSDSEEHSVTPLERKSFMQPTELSKQRQRQLQVETAQSIQMQKHRAALKRTLRKQRRAASNDLYERSTATTAAFDSYLLCYDEMDMPPQLQPRSPSLNRHSVSRPSPSSSVASSPSRRDTSVQEVQQRLSDMSDLSLPGAQPLELLSPDAEPRSTPLLQAHLQSPIPLVTIPPPEDSATESIQSRHAINDPIEASELLPASSTNVELAQPPCTPHEDPPISRTTTMSSTSSDNFDCSDIDDMLEYFEGVTLPI